jgi:alkylation response protein AidB-like acyl-CoA dehydrogenase
MDFNLSKEQELLREGLAKFLSTRYDLEKSRAAAKTGPGWQPDIWRGFADELGILGAALPEDVGGIGGGPVEVMVIAEALGYALVVEPYVDTAVQLHGGMGMTEELAIGHYFKRLTALQFEFGSTDYHVARYASLS